MRSIMTPLSLERVTPVRISATLPALHVRLVNYVPFVEI